MAYQAQLHHGSPIMEDHTPAAFVPGGTFVTVGDYLHIAHLDIPAGRLGALATRHGVYLVPKSTANGSAIPKGKLVYWDATNGVATMNSNSGANKKVGETVDFDTADADTQVAVLHSPV